MDETAIWTWHFWAAAAILLLALLNTFVPSLIRKKSVLSALHGLLIGVFLSALLLLLPAYRQEFSGQDNAALKAWTSSLHHAFQLFTLDADRDFIMNLPTQEPWQAQAAGRLLILDLLFAPALTFSFVISFFKNASGHIRYVLRFFTEAYVFSELNDRSLALAKSIKNNKAHRWATIVFTDVFAGEDESAFELIEEAKTLHAIFLKKDIQLVRFGIHSRRKLLRFFAIGDDEKENIAQSLHLIAQYRQRKKTWLYIFSTRTECELLLNRQDPGEMQVRRINAVQSLIYNHLYENGVRLFEAADLAAEAQTAPAGNKKTVHAIVVGMGQYGTEMVKALAWFGQMPGYRMAIDAYDSDASAEERFSALCPELMDEAHNGREREGDASCQIRIHSGVSVSSPAFAGEILRATDVCYVFVSLGSDEENIHTAVSLRVLFEKIRDKNPPPVIDAVVYHENDKPAVSSLAQQIPDAAELTDYKGNSYAIRFIGRVEDVYSEKTILGSAMENEAITYHTKWAGTSEEKEAETKKFYRYEYYYRSSCSAVIHVKTLVRLLKKRKVTPQDVDRMKDGLMCQEHCRWNAYMRSEGYTYANPMNRLGKQHADLVPYGELSPGEPEKDDYADQIKKHLAADNA